MDARTLAAAHWNWCQANAAFMGTSAPGEALECRHVSISSCGFPDARFNIAALRVPVEDLAAALARALDYFAERALPFRVAVPSDEVACAADLAARGFRETERVPAMLLATLREAPAAPPGLEVAAVRRSDDLEAFRATAFEGFGLPTRIAPLFLSDALAARPDVELYVGRLRGEPVCTSALVATGPVAGIYWVATREGFRGRGFGEAATWAAVAGGLARGCRFASLQASALGRPVYERMGFATPCHYVHYEPPRPDA